ncbi:MAG TPA: hypothetical protein VGV61_04595 [Thermoanaerobaculia bacterium]|jgi:hypothetical protein|nr:hypothetical protein [Thermoanaerobaculia bacterium]
MSSLFLLLVGLWAGSAFAAGAVDRQLGEAATLQRLPLGFAREEARRLVLVFHQDPDQPAAGYLAANAGGQARLALYAPHFLRGLQLRPLADLPVDLSEAYFNALLEAYLRRQLGLPGSELGVELRRRALSTMTDVPVARRLEAYVDAQTSFGSHLLSVANELDRSQQRRQATGRSLCGLLSRPLPLFTLWERALGDGGYPGAYVLGGPPGEGALRFSRSVLTASDKRLMVERVLRAPWVGSVAADLTPRYCHR